MSDTKQKVLDAIARGKEKHALAERLKREAVEAEIRRKRELVERHRTLARVWVENTLPRMIEEAASAGLTRLKIDTDLPDPEGDVIPYKADACREVGLEVVNMYFPTSGDGYLQSTPAHHVYYVVW